MRIADALEALRARWPGSPKSGAPEECVVGLERLYGVILPDEFRRYLLQTVPTGDCMDQTGITWLAIGGIKSLTEVGSSPSSTRGCADIENEAHQYLVFADYLVWCYGYAICCSAGEHRGKIALVDEGGVFVADSFSGFVGLVLEDSKEIRVGP